MSALKLGPLLDDKPVRLTVELPAAIHRDLAAYAEALAREAGQPVEPSKLIAPMVARFMATDRNFVKSRRRAALRVDQGSGNGRADDRSSSSGPASD